MKKEAQPTVTEEQGGVGVMVYGAYNREKDEVVWHLVNNTDETKYVGLVRGATLGGEEVPEYLFGDAFADVYYLTNMARFTVGKEMSGTYNLAVYNGEKIGFVFKIPAKKTIEVPEYGFVDMTDYKAYTVEVEFTGVNLFMDIYNYDEVIAYEDESGISGLVLPDPYGFVSAIVTTKEKLGYDFHMRELIPIFKEEKKKCRWL